MTPCNSDLITHSNNFSSFVHGTTSSSPMGMPVPVAYIAGAVSAVIILLLIITCSTLIVILIAMKRRTTLKGTHTASKITSWYTASVNNKQCLPVTCVDSEGKGFDNSAKNNSNRQ